MIIKSQFMFLKFIFATFIILKISHCEQEVPDYIYEIEDLQDQLKECQSQNDEFEEKIYELESYIEELEM